MTLSLPQPRNPRRWNFLVPFGTFWYRNRAKKSFAGRDVLRFVEICWFFCGEKNCLGLFGTIWDILGPFLAEKNCLMAVWMLVTRCWICTAGLPPPRARKRRSTREHVPSLGKTGVFCCFQPVYKNNANP